MVPLLLCACAAPVVRSGPPELQVARLDAAGGDAAAFAAIAERFAANNPGYELTWHPACTGLPAAERARIAFVQAGRGTATFAGRDGPSAASELTVGDLVVLRPGEALRCEPPFGLLVFALPDVPEVAVPPFVRPDQDPRITDTPGGCATETGAYRRILLTWLGKNGPYTYRGLNAHRVRIADSFTHYHPPVGGFDEFYLVQMVQPGACLLTSDQLDQITAPASVTPAAAGRLLRRTELQVGDLVYLPRGLVHRGLGGVLAQVITVPGFVPGAEIGVDHHLRAINDRLGLQGTAALPLHADGATGPVVR